MKKIFALIAAIGAIGFAVPTTAEANHRIVSYTSCGRPVYAQYQVVGYQRCGTPIGRWVTLPAHCGCNVCVPRPVFNHGGFHHGGFNHGGFHHGGYQNGGFCAPQRPIRRSGGSIFLRFGR